MLKLNRRQLLCNSSGLITYGSLSQAAPNTRQLKMAVIGIGQHGINHISGCKTETLVALCDPDSDRLQIAAQQVPDSALFEDYRVMFQKCELDAVVISTPIHLHCHIAREAIGRGIHCYIEKPLAYSIDQVRELVKLDSNSLVINQMGNQHHGKPGYREVVALLKSGLIGPIQECHAWTNKPLWTQGNERPRKARPPKSLDYNLWLGPAQATTYRRDLHPFQWRGWWQFGCGALGDMGPHLLDPVFEGLRLPLPSRVRAASQNSTKLRFPDASVIEMDFESDHSEPFTIYWYDGGWEMPLDVIGVNQPPPNGVMLIGTRGRVFIPELGGKPRLMENPGANLSWKFSTTVTSYDHLENWIQACKRPGPKRTSLSHGGLLTEACQRGNVALYTGREVTDDVIQEYLDRAGTVPFVKANWRRDW